MLEQPSARRVLLDPQASAIAIGPEVRPKSRRVSALVSSYTFYESDDHTCRRLVAARAAPR